MKNSVKTKQSVIRIEEREANGYKYRFELLRGESQSTASYRIPLYSVRVTLTEPNGKSGSAEIKEVFADGGKALLFFDKVVRNLATPVDLAYIFEDELR